MNAVKARAYLWLILALGIAGICIMQFYNKFPLQTNLLLLLPPTERNPVAEHAVQKLADIAGNRAVFLVGHPSSESATKAASAFSSSLSEHHVFRKIIANIPAVDPKQLTEVYLQYRFTLLADTDRNLLMNGNVNLENRLQQKLYAPFQFGLTLSPADDPFGFTDAWIASLPLKNLKLEPENGMLVTHSVEEWGAENDKTGTNKIDITWVFVSAELTGSAYDNHVQQQVVDAVSIAEAKIKEMYPTTEVLRTGTVFYAETARANAEREVDFIGAGSLVGMLALLYLVFRSIRPLVLGLLSVGFGISAALATTVWVYGEIHLITLVFGASLIGEAIDYAIQYFAAHLGAGKNWEPVSGLRRIAPGLTVALATSLLGYSALTLAPFPALSQIGLFALVGLGSAWLSVFLLLPALLVKPNERDPEVAVAGPRFLLNWWQAHVTKRVCYVIAAIILAVSIPGWLQLYADDDVHLLISRPPLLASQESKIRELSGIGNISQFFLVEGNTADEVLINEEKLTARLAAWVEQGKISSYQGVSSFVPSIATQLKNRELWSAHVFSDEQAFKATLENAGLRDEVIKKQMDTFKTSEGSILSIEDWLKSPISASVRNLWLGQTNSGFAALVLPQGINDVASLQDIAADLNGITFVDKAGSISELLKNYREWGSVWILGLIALVYGVLFVRYKGLQALVIMTPTLLAISLTFGIFGYSHIPLSLFNIMALMLVLGVGINYSIFLREGGVHAAASLAGVFLSAGTTLLSFGLLAFSSMQALSSFGLTLLIGVGIAVLVAPIVLTFESKHA
jgi:predicted exporter